MFWLEVFNSWDNWMKNRKTIRELNGLSDRELSDLGINRASIRHVVKKGR